MRIEKLIWLETIIEKLEKKHNLKPFEIDELFINKPIFRYIEKGNLVNENVYAGYGQTNAKRYLIVFFIYKKGNQALIISARNMTEKEKSYYVKKKKFSL